MRDGMTLVEVLVGLTVSSLALTIGFGSLAMVRSTGDRATEALDASIREDAARDILMKWLEGVRLLPEGAAEFRGIDGEVEGWGASEVIFLTTAATRVHGRETIVHVFIDRDERTPEQGLVAELRDWRRTRVQRLQLAGGAMGLRARFLSGVPGDDTWFPSWISTTVLPRGLELWLEARSPEALPTTLRRPLRLRVGTGR
jgi:prepilin-type N-terminal cleavage/methylation domain-containing protein